MYISLFKLLNKSKDSSSCWNVNSLRKIKQMIKQRNSFLVTPFNQTPSLSLMFGTFLSVTRNDSFILQEKHSLSSSPNIIYRWGAIVKRSWLFFACQYLMYASLKSPKYSQTIVPFSKHKSIPNRIIFKILLLYPTEIEFHWPQRIVINIWR